MLVSVMISCQAGYAIPAVNCVSSLGSIVRQFIVFKLSSVDVPAFALLKKCTVRCLSFLASLLECMLEVSLALLLGGMY